MVEGEEGLKLQPNLMAAPGFELVVAEIVVPPYPPTFLPKCENPQQSYSEEEQRLRTRRCALQVTLSSAASL